MTLPLKVIIRHLRAGRSPNSSMRVVWIDTTRVRRWFRVRVPADPSRRFALDSSFIEENPAKSVTSGETQGYAASRIKWQFISQQTATPRSTGNLVEVDRTRERGNEHALHAPRAATTARRH